MAAENRLYPSFLSLLIPVAFLLSSFYVINDFGETSDEGFDKSIGNYYYYEWSTHGLQGLESTLRPLKRNYGPLFDYLSVASHELLHQKSQLIGSSVASYHVPTILACALLIWITFKITTLFASPFQGFLSASILSLFPRFIGDSQNNLKDTPMAALFALSLYLGIVAVRTQKTRHFLLLGIAIGLVYCIKINAILIPLVLITWYILSREIYRGSLKSVVSKTCIAGIFFFLTILLFWPYYRYSPIDRFFETFHSFSNHEWNGEIFYFGALLNGRDVPWPYPFVMLAITTPPIFLGSALFGLFSLFNHFKEMSREGSQFWLLTSWILITTLPQALADAPMYDGVRHFHATLPAVAILSARGLERIFLYLAPKSIWKQWSLCLLTLLHPLLTIISLHPYQIVYFNSLVGGIQGAYGKFDLDYWGQSYKEITEWISQNIPHGSVIWVPNGAQQINVDPNLFSIISDNDYPDYKISLVRGMSYVVDPGENILNPRRPPIFSVQVEGVDLARVFHYPENKLLREKLISK